MQIIVMTSDKSAPQTLLGFAHLFNKYWSPTQHVDIFGFSGLDRLLRVDDSLPDNHHYHSIGKQEDYPFGKWSNVLHNILQQYAEDKFILLLDDYWLIRKVDVDAVRTCAKFMDTGGILKIDLTRERLNSQPDRFSFDANTFAHMGHVDFIESLRGSDYQMSLWGGMWNREKLARLILPNESPHQIELDGTHRLNEIKTGFRVFGTRQAPMLHGNVLIKHRGEELVFSAPNWSISTEDLRQLLDRGYVR